MLDVLDVLLFKGNLLNCSEKLVFKRLTPLTDMLCFLIFPVKSEVGASCRDIVAEAQLHQPPSHQHSGPGIGEDGEGASSISGSQMDESPLRPLSFAT